MFRKARGIALCLGSLARPVGVATAAALCFGAVVTGCTDENDPKTWVSELNDPAKQVQAVNRIVQKYEDSLTEDKKDRTGAHVKPLLDTVIEPMTKLCTDGKMTDQTRSKVIKFIADSWDKRGVPCLKKVLEDYKPGTNEGDVQQVMRAESNTKMPDLEDGVVKVFMALKATDAASRQDNMYLDVQNATIAVATKAHEDDFIKLLQRPMPDDPKKDPKGTTNEWYWQVNAALILGNLHSEKAIKPLLTVLLTPSKFNSVIGNDALTALVKIGKPVIAPASALLTSSSDAADLIKVSTDENLKAAADIKDPKQLEAAKKAAEKAHIPVAAQVLGAIAREDVAAPLIGALDKADDQTKAVIAAQLPNLPRTDDTEKAFKNVYENIKVDLQMPNGDGAKERLLGSVVNFYDANLVPWLIEQADDKHFKGAEAPDVESVRVATLVAAMSLMKDDQVEDVKKFAATKGADGKTEIGKAFAKTLDRGKEVLDACKDKADCYLDKMTDPKSQEKEAAEGALKAGYMIGVFGKQDLKAKIVDSLPKFSNPGLKQEALSLILFFSPKGDKDTAKKLQEVIDKAAASKDQEAIQDAVPLKQVVALLNARAE